MKPNLFTADSTRKELHVLLIIGALYSLGIFLSNTFVNIYLWKQTNDLINIAMYNLAIYVAQTILFTLSGSWAKRIDRVIILRIGVFFLSVFFLLVLFTGEKAASYNLLLGAVLGIGYGMYWLAYSVLTFEVTEPETRDFFNGVSGLLQSLTGMIGPFVAGYIITRMNNSHGYTLIFAVSFFLFLLAVICTAGIKRRGAEGKFGLRQVWKEVKHDSAWRNTVLAHVFQGVREGIYTFIISVWVFIVTNSELSLGTFNLVYSAFSFIFYYIATRYIKSRQRKTAIFLSGVALSLSVVLLLVELNFTTLLIYAAIIGVFYPILYVPYLSLTYDVIGKARDAAKLRVEYIVLSDVATNIGRIFSVVLLLIGVGIWADASIPYLMFILGTGPFFIYFFTRHIKSFAPAASVKKLPKNEIAGDDNR
ncbi:MFS transporter [Terribacillus saccharophilus]|uniref:MFS transporter n=1 Tax=Terribacillus saccharophilus TaxID=361277 RepID=A0A268ADM4_9BACI|nr:MFS transporter [Terribacillus saccharophilus]PAD22224.1 MFS transporter [Terribacillus saccharophilus]PAF19302.1 MFS transporter [Terribacillus saccharophilus]PAF22643.1 MFS transporter [Terribacillus saccharophilus]PAF38853.1 MFS transporter [Terribacillus saccharophilus]PAF40827.1 MFS transporter [Terribacillus saccharophilus]